MGLFTKAIVNMDDLFVHQLKDIYYAEKRIAGALSKMVEKATASELKQGFEKHLGETKNHIRRVERIFELQGIGADTAACPAIDGLIKEVNDVVSEVSDRALLDAALVAAAQAVEHYEITRYGTLIAWAKELGADDTAELLEQNLAEEHATDKKLTELAKSSINRAAA